MAATSMMKEYLKKQLKYWLDNFKDDQLPRDFNSKNFARPQITLTKIALKPDKIAALLNIPAPLIVTRATCSELVIKVPSWSVAEKFVQEPLPLRLGDLFIDVKNIAECEEHVRRDSVARSRAASMEPDPLGSIASMYQFGTVINERLEIMVENVYVKLYEKQTLRWRLELSHFHARTTNAMWQDMRDLTECVDRSPDGLLKTRFKFVSTQANVYLHPPGAQTTDQQAPPPLRLLKDHSIAMRMTLFGHRKSKNDSWETLSHVVDLNLETLPFEFDVRQVQQIFIACSTLAKWINDAAAVSQDNSEDHLLPHQIVRGPLTPKRKPTEPANDSVDQPNDTGDTDSSTFALQVTVRFTAHALLRIPTEFRGDLQVAIIAQHAAINWIQHQSSSHEVQVTVHHLSIRHKDKVLFHIKPAREVLQYKRLSHDGDSIFLKWHLQKLECHLENEMAIIANEIYHSFNEIEQAAAITCGTCHHKIALDAIATHVCSASPLPRQASPKEVPKEAKAIAKYLNSANIPKLRVLFSLDELEITTDSHLFRTVHELMRRPKDLNELKQPPPAPSRRYTVRMNEFSVSTESKEFVGAAIFVPVLPLAFQMLECTIRGCGCVERHQRKQRQRRNQKHVSEQETAEIPVDSGRTCSFSRVVPRWPDRIFAELGHFSVRSIDTVTKLESFLIADATSLRLSFSDGIKVCPQSTPQMSSFFNIDRIRCQLDHRVFQYLRRSLTSLQDPMEGQRMKALTLFFAVLDVRNVELTMLQEHTHPGTDTIAKMKGQFRQVGGIADNHLGRLSLQTNFDFRALLHSEAVEFDFASSHHHESSVAQPAETKRERRRRREEEKMVEGTVKIQRAFRRFTADRRQQLDLELRRLTREDCDGDEAAAMSVDRVASQRGESEQDRHSTSSSSSIKRRPSAGKQATSLLSAAAEDLAAISPMKMVAAAGVLKDGVMGFVKAKQQMIETEMGELATQSKESAARFMPKYSAVKNLLSPRATSAREGDAVEKKYAEVRAVERGQPTEEDTAVEENIEDVPLDETVHDEAEDLEQAQGEDHADDEPGSDDRASEDEDEGEEDGPLFGAVPNESDTDNTAPALSPTETLLASLPAIVRVMVQVEEHRMCVPISPRESVSVLCGEIVRRFNEMFGQNGVITHVTLQNPQGGVYAGSDIVGVVHDPAKSELFFAYPHSEDAEIKSVVHINLSSEPHSPGKDAVTGGGSKTTSFNTKKPACEFNRCSKLPLPLVVALLANESERDLMHHLLSQSGPSSGRTSVDDWPELALNASFLDPTKDMLQVEVSWQDKNLEVTNSDAFLLCLQQLGLGTARANSKSVGKVLRDRLKMDTKNPLIYQACAASPEFQSDLNQQLAEHTEDGDENMASKRREEAATDGVSYGSLKEIVQEDYGVYLRRKR